MIFDNGNKQFRGTSRALAFRLVEGNKFKQTLSIELPDSLFTFKQGSVYQIDKNKFLFSSTMTNYLIITDSIGDILWMAKSNEPFYRAEYLDDF